MLSRAPAIEITKPAGSSHRVDRGASPVAPDADDSEIERHEPRSPSTLAGSPMNAYFSDSDKPGHAMPNGKKAPETSANDPVTAQIMRRTGTGSTIAKLKAAAAPEEADSSGAGTSANGGARPSGEGVGGALAATAQGAAHRGKKKGVSFLSRILPGSKKRAGAGAAADADEDELGDGERRTEGMDAHVFSQPIGYIPTHAAPPKYIRVSSHHKPVKDFNQMFLAQELSGRARQEDAASIANGSVNGSVTSLPKHKSGAIWAMKFSLDGKYMAAAGQDMVVRVWQVLSSKEERNEHEREEDAAGAGEGGYPNDSGIRLNAPVFRSEPIREYYGHTGDVLDLSWSKNNFLLSSSMDKTVRLWHVTRQECLCSFQHSDFVTSIAFHPRDDRFFLAGSLDSKLRLWSIPDKSVAYWNELPDLITAVAFTPDGRMAIAGCLNGLCLFYETEGLRYHTQLHVRSSHGRNAKGSKITGIETAVFPPDDPNGEVKILVTSNDSRIRMYNARDKSLETKFKGNENTSSQIHASFSDDGRYIICGSEDRRVYIWNAAPAEAEKKDKRPVEFFEAHPAIVTVGIIAPTKTKLLLGTSGDPLFDLCNPPPVTLVPRSHSPPHTPPATASTTTSNPAWLAKSAHPDGNIIVTADYQGRIKIFRQDCAAQKRRNDSWETSSTFSKKLSTSGLLRKSSTRSHDPPDRILSWRHSVTSNASWDSQPSLRAAPVQHSIRAASPAKSNRAPANRLSVRSLVLPDQSVSRSTSRTRSSLRGEEGALGVPRAPDLGVSSAGESDDEGLGGFSSDSEGEVMRCKKCASTSFKARRGRGGGQRLVCVKCNTVTS